MTPSPGATSELSQATDAAIDAAVQHADPMVLRGLLHQQTGDEEVASIRPTPQVGIDAAKLADPGAITRLRAKAAGFLKARRDTGDHRRSPRPRRPRARRAAAAQPRPRGRRRCGAGRRPRALIEELALDPYVRGLAPVEAARGFEVVVIGAGMGGLNVAVQLAHAGIDFTVVEKNGGVGGTWYENRYPGARVDSPSRTYSHIVGVDFDARYPFCPRAENERYFDWIADRYHLRDRIVLDTEVTSLDGDEAAARWEVRAKGPDGERVWRPNVVVSAVGVLSRPSVPAIAGGDFAGLAFHSSWWPSDLGLGELGGKRVGVIGTGAPACS